MESTMRIISENTADLQSKYGLSIKQAGREIFWLESARCRIQLVLDRSLAELNTVNLYTSDTGPFNLFLIILLRNSLRVPHGEMSSVKLGEENLSREIASASENIVIFCEDILQGSAAEITANGKYDNFRNKMHLAFAASFAFAKDDPRAVKVKNGDWSWAGCLIAGNGAM